MHYQYALLSLGTEESLSKKKRIREASCLEEEFGLGLRLEPHKAPVPNLPFLFWPKQCKPVLSPLPSRASVNEDQLQDTGMVSCSDAADNKDDGFQDQGRNSTRDRRMFQTMINLKVMV